VVRVNFWKNLDWYELMMNQIDPGRPIALISVGQLDRMAALPPDLQNRKELG